MATWERNGQTIEDFDVRSRGHRWSYDPVREVGFWLDDGEPLPAWGGQEKSCAACGHMPTADGYDACLGPIAGAISACCGHGYDPGLVWFADGRREEDARGHRLELPKVPRPPCACAP